MTPLRRWPLRFALAAALVLGTAVSAFPQASARVAVRSSNASLSWIPLFPTDGAALTVVGPNIEIKRTFERGRRLSFRAEDDAGQRLPDGSYNWEVVLKPIVPTHYKNRNDGRTAADIARLAPRDRFGNRLTLRDTPVATVASGVFRIENGVIVDPDRAEPNSGEAQSGSLAGAKNP